MSLSYLKAYEHLINLKKLETIKAEREKTREFSNVKPLKEKVDRLFLKKAQFLNLYSPYVEIGKREEMTDEEFKKIEELSLDFIPWRKGPFRLFGLEIDAEWRSDYKWERLTSFLPPLKNKRILDIGCNNGYYMFRMAHENPELILGIDPVARLLEQFRFLNHFAQIPNIHFELFGHEHLHHFKNFFNVIFSMGVIYHTKDPLGHLQDISSALVEGGTLILETMAIPGEDSFALIPEDRYAQMRNVWFVPTLNCLLNWVGRNHFEEIEIISSSVLTLSEQRRTRFCPPPWQSLEQFLDPNDFTKTVEGLPAPLRIALKAKKKKS